jgi:hypothetical protein
MKREPKLKELMATALQAALQACDDARKAYERHTFPRVPRGRLKRFELRLGEVQFVYPATRYMSDEPQTDAIEITCRGTKRNVCFYSNRLREEAEDIVDKLSGYPSRVLALVRWLERIERWLRARAEGHKRHAEEVLRQQSHAVAEIQNRATAVKLTETGT